MTKSKSQPKKFHGIKKHIEQNECIGDTPDILLADMADYILRRHNFGKEKRAKIRSDLLQRHHLLNVDSAMEKMCVVNHIALVDNPPDPRCVIDEHADGYTGDLAPDVDEESHDVYFVQGKITTKEIYDLYWLGRKLERQECQYHASIAFLVSGIIFLFITWNVKPLIENLQQYWPF